MKKTFLAVLLAGSNIGMFAQTTPTTTPTSPTTSPTTAPASPTTSPTNPGTSPATPTTTLPATAPQSNPATTNGSVTNSTSDGMNTTTNPNPAINKGTMNTTNSSPNNGAPANLGWSNYGIWNNSAAGSMNTNRPTANNSAVGSDRTATNEANNFSTGTGTPVTAVPYNVQTNYGKDYSAAASGSGTWNQYGDWYYTTYRNNGRYSQIMYDQRGNGYSIALPVLTTYVPENIVTMALQKYGSSLYSITMLKAADGKDAFQINVLNRGQVKPEWIADDGATAATIYRTEEMSNAAGTLSATQTNAAMDNSGASGTVANDQSTLNGRPDQDTTGTGTGKKMKSKKHNADGTVTKTVTKPNGSTKMKTKHKSSMRKDSTGTGNMQQ